MALAITFGFGGATAAVRDEGNRRFALVIGNASYANLPELPGTVVDAHAMAAALRERGYRVVERTDVSSLALAGPITDFSIDAAGASQVAFVYFGHGAEIDGIDRLLPIDADPVRPATILADAFSLAALGPSPRLHVIIDAQRSVGLRGAKTFGRVLAREASKGEILVALAAQADSIARNDKEGHAAFAAALLTEMTASGLSGEAYMGEVTRRVKNATDDRQTPWFRSTIPPGLAIPLGPKPPLEPQAPVGDVFSDVQHQLQLIGCLSGAVDKAWGKASIKALQRYYRVKGRKGPLDPGSYLLARLESETERLCPLLANPVEQGKTVKTAPVSPTSKPPKPPIKTSGPTIVVVKPAAPAAPPLIQKEAEATSGRKIKSGPLLGVFRP